MGLITINIFPSRLARRILKNQIIIVKRLNEMSQLIQELTAASAALVEELNLLKDAVANEHTEVAAKLDQLEALIVSLQEQLDAISADEELQAVLNTMLAAVDDIRGLQDEVDAIIDEEEDPTDDEPTDEDPPVEDPQG